MRPGTLTGEWHTRLRWIPVPATTFVSKTGPDRDPATRPGAFRSTGSVDACSMSAGGRGAPGLSPIQAIPALRRPGGGEPEAAKIPQCRRVAMDWVNGRDEGREYFVGLLGQGRPRL